MIYVKEWTGTFKTCVRFGSWLRNPLWAVAWAWRCSCGNVRTMRNVRRWMRAEGLL